MHIIDTALLQEITQKAQKNDRLRMNHNLHSSLDDKVQRLLNAIEPGTVIPIHRHQNTDEIYILLQGRIKVFLHDNLGKVVNALILDPKQGTFGIQIPAGQWHSLEVLESGSVLFEVKEGPYRAIAQSDLIV